MRTGFLWRHRLSFIYASIMGFLAVGCERGHQEPWRPRSAAERAQAISAARWRTAMTPHASLAALVGSAAEPLLPAISTGVERAITSDLELLGQPRADVTLRLYFVGARQQMTPFTGSTAGGWSVPEAQMAFFVANDTVRPALRHELLHLLAWQLWGEPTSVWMSEGLATVAGSPCRGYSVDDIVAAIDRAGRLPPFDDLRFRFVYRDEQGAIEYFEAASLVEYIMRVDGRDRLRTMWREADPGNDVSAFETQWHAEITRHSPPATWDTIFRTMRAHGCE